MFTLPRNKPKVHTNIRHQSMNDVCCNLLAKHYTIMKQWNTSKLTEEEIELNTQTHTHTHTHTHKELCTCTHAHTHTHTHTGRKKKRKRTDRTN